VFGPDRFGQLLPLKEVRVFPSRFMPCTECGASVARDEAEQHRCDPERLLDFVMFGLRDEIAAFEPRLSAFLDSPQGQFHRWLAAREVRASRD
jgi:hypothetical protein